MHYDIAAKLLVEKCRDEILRRLLGLTFAESALLEEMPQETVSVRRSDFPILVREHSGPSRLVLLEIQSRWERRFPIRLLDYRSRYLLKYDVEVLSCVLLLKSSPEVTSEYRDHEVHFRYRVIPIYELDAEAVIRESILCLVPFVPLMKGGEANLDAADHLLVHSPLSRADKADMLTAMAILSGLASPSYPQKLLARRRDIMIESAAYELIKNEGLQEGLQQGMQQGQLQALREMVLDTLEARFELAPRPTMQTLQELSDPLLLKKLHKKAVTAESLDAFEAFMKRLLES